MLSDYSSVRAVALIVKRLGGQAFSNEKGFTTNERENCSSVGHFSLKGWLCVSVCFGALLFITEREVGK